MVVLCQALSEAIQFGKTPPCILCTNLHANPHGGIVFMSNIDFLGAYARVYIWLDDLPWLAFVPPPHPSNHETLIGFHLSLPIGYVDSEK